MKCREGLSVVEKVINCRSCGSTAMINVIDLGAQSLTGIFPRATENDPSFEPLVLLRCTECDLVQLAHNFDADLMYGDNYGYRSGLNKSMVLHLKETAKYLMSLSGPMHEKAILDIGSNDGTFLSFFRDQDVTSVGCDPTIKKFANYYEPGIIKIEDFFPSPKVNELGLKFKIVTSIAMYYDLEDPIKFTQAIENILEDEGLWYFELSYLPLMIKNNAYDTICHEHLEYYSLKSINYILSKSKLKIIDARLNEVNGGSIAVVVAKIDSKKVVSERYLDLLSQEDSFFREKDKVFKLFETGVLSHRDELKEFLRELISAGNEVWAIGASTKGNVLLQFCGLTSSDIKGVSEINPDKFGCVTPGSRIPIVPESDIPHNKKTYAVVLPWHFKENIIEREKDFILSGGTLIFPLPEIVLVNAQGERKI
jgi:hypothetical protein